MGIDPHLLAGGTPKRKVRHLKKAFPGKKISIPTNPPIRAIDQEIQKMRENGRFTLGEECTHFQLTKYTPCDGKIVAKEVLVCGRKIPLLEIRDRLIKRHEKYMRLPPDSAIEQLSRSKLLQALSMLDNATHEEYATEELRKQLS